MKLIKQAEQLGVTNLPDAMLAHGDAVLQALKEKIVASHLPLSFEAFMRFALFEPGLGYYSAGTTKIGEQGDFITAPEISPLFARSIARSVSSYLMQQPGDILELGAGLGSLAIDILKTLNKLLPSRVSYYILEPSADLQARQKARIKEQAPELLEQVQWIHTLPNAFNGVILANEVLDALPVQRFRIHDKQVQSESVVVDSDDNIVAQWVSADPALADRLRQSNIDIANLPDGFVSEVNLGLDGFIASVADCLDKGLIYFVDYGYPASHYYLAERNEGTLMCYFQHRQHSDPFILIGLQDITAHVDFTAVANAALNHKLAVRAFDSQANFLMQCGILNELQAEEMSMQAQLAQSQALQTLLSPGGMGEVFKVMILSKHFDLEILGCTPNDSRYKL